MEILLNSFLDLIIEHVTISKKKKNSYRIYFSYTAEPSYPPTYLKPILNSFLQTKRDISQDVCSWSTFLYLSSKYMQMSPL